MTNTEAQTAMNSRAKVAAGKTGTDDYDTGWVVSVDGDMAEVSWDSGVRTPCPLSLLRFKN